MKFWQPNVRHDRNTSAFSHPVLSPGKVISTLFPFVVEQEASYQAWFKILFWLGMGLAFISLAFMSGTPLIGDETVYRQNAEVIAKFLLNDGASAQMALEKLVGNGWFMPGMSIVTAPLFAAVERPDIFLIRGYIALFTFVLWFWAIRETARFLGPPYALALMIMPSLSIVCQLFSNTLWAEFSGGLILIIALCRGYALAVQASLQKSLPWREIVQLEAILIFLVYMRSPMFLIVIGLHLFLISLMVIFWNREACMINLVRVVFGGTLFCAMLAPWSIAASYKLGGPVLTTSTINVSIGMVFGDYSKLCFGPCPKGNHWSAAARFSRQHAANTGKDQLTVQREMTRYSLKGVTVREYLHKVRRNFGQFFLMPNFFATRFVEKSRVIADEYRGLVFSTLSFLNNPIYFLALAATFMANMMIFRQHLPNQILGLMIKMFSICICFQPFIHFAHTRYWPTFAPLMGIAAGFLTVTVITKLSETRSVKKNSEKENLSTINRQGEKILFAIQILSLVMMLTVGAMVVIA